jgi:hypothetical protein
MITKYVNPNFVKASNLILLGGAMGIGIYFFNGSSLELFQLAIFALVILFILVTALLIRQGYVWAKWVFTILTVLLWTTLYHAIPQAFNKNSLVGWLTVLQNLLDLVAIVLLFLPTKQPLINNNETTII